MITCWSDCQQTLWFSMGQRVTLILLLFSFKDGHDNEGFAENPKADELQVCKPGYIVRIVFYPRKRNPCSTYVISLSRTPESFFPLFNLNEVCICNHYSGRAPRTLHWKGYLMTLGFVVVLADFKTNPTMVSQEVLHHSRCSRSYGFSIVAIVVLIAKLLRTWSAQTGAPWVIELGYLCIQEILVVTKSTVRTYVLM